MHPAAETVVDPPGTVTITPALPSSQPDEFQLLAGSQTHLVYLDGGTQDAAGNTDVHLIDRLADGTVHDLGSIASCYLDDDNRGSLVGDLFSLLCVHGSKVDVDWWHLDAGTSGTMPLPFNSTYIGSSPDGMVYTGGSHTNTLYEQSTAGVTTDLGTPFPSSTSLSGIAGPDGVEVSNEDDNGQAAYVAWSSPGAFTTLSGGDMSNCSGIDSAYVACVYKHKRHFYFEIVPLSGAPTITVSGRYSYGAAALVGARMFWRDGSHIYSATAADPTATSGDATFAADDNDQFIAAYDGAVGLDTTHGHVLMAKDVAHIETLLTVPAAPTQTRSFGLGPNELAYTDDRGGGFGDCSTWQSRLSVTHHVVKVAPTQLVHARADSDEVPAASSSLVAYPVTIESRTSYHIVGHGHDFHVPTSAYIHQVTVVPRLAGSRALYGIPATRKSSASWHVYDAKTTHTSTLHHLGPLANYTDVAMSSKYFGYARADGSVWRMNLHTGAQQRVARPLTHIAYGSVFLAGPYVGWSFSGGSRSHTINGYRDMRHGKAVRVKRPIAGMSSAGLLQISDTFAGEVPPSARHVTVALRTFRGKTLTLLPKQLLFALPRISGSAIAWTDSEGHLKVAPLPDVR